MKLSMMKRIALIGLIAWFAGLSDLQAQEEWKPTASADIGILSKYVWRGYELSNDSIVIQPSVTVGYKGFAFNLWGNLDTDRDQAPDNGGDFNETDLTFSYEKQFDLVSLSGGYIYYGLDGMDDAQELFVGATLNTLLSPTLTAYRETADLQGWYFNLGLSHSFSLPKEMTLDLAASIGYYLSQDDNFVQLDDNLNALTEKYKNFHDGSVSIGLTVPVGKYGSFSPMIAYSFPLSDEADNLITGGSFDGESDFFYGGATISLSF